MRGISSLIDTDMEDSTHFLDENMIISSASEGEVPQKKAARPKVADNRITKPKSAPRKPKAVKEGARKAPSKAATTKRKALEEQANGETQQATKKSCTAFAAQSEDELDKVTNGEEPKQEAKANPKRKAKTKDARENGDKFDHDPAFVEPSQSQNALQKPKVAQRAMKTDLQPVLTELDSNAEVNTTCSPQRPVKSVVRSASRPRQENVCRRRAGSASDTERAVGDPNLRRKLGDVTRKFENIDLKYRNLKDVGVSEANANMEKLRKQCEATTAASAELIASLKKELAMQMPLAHEARQLQVELQNATNTANTYRSTVSDLETSLATAQNEIKALQAKLAAARSSATFMESASAKTPGSAMKNSSQVRTVIGSAETAQAAQTAQLKEDLYSDLTGLIIRSVKRTAEGDAYDCIQTGRNGSKCSWPNSIEFPLTWLAALHFKLVVEPEGDGRTTSFEDTEFLYTPLLDPNRDKDMLEMLPYYLKEDITFSRHHAAKFYSRVVDALTKKAMDD
jgi:Chromosome segregation protein Csm1/Pcs1